MFFGICVRVFTVKIGGNQRLLSYGDLRCWDRILAFFFCCEWVKGCNMADERMKAVVEEDEVEDGGGEVGLQEMVEREEEDDELELSLSLVNQGWNAGFTSGWPARNASTWSEQGAGSSLDVKRSGRVRQLDTGEGTKDWGEVGDSRESLMETEPLPHISPLFADYLDMKMGAIFGRDKDAQHKRPKIFSNQQ